MNKKSSWDFIIDGMRLSFSSVTSFETCKGGWKLNYIDKVDSIDNFFSQYGKLVHECMEKYFKGELDAFELSGYYRDNFNNFVKAQPPSYPKGMGENYKEQGQDFFDNFTFNIEDYEILAIEDSASFNLDINGESIMFIAKPDLLLKHKDTGLISLLDFKTSNPFRKYKGQNVEDKKKTEGYYKQLYTYAHAVRETKGIQVSILALWFLRMGGEMLTVDWNEFDEKDTLDWLKSGIEKILAEEEFAYDKSNEYFCKNLCSVRHHCPMWK
jgi:hypothetical protein